MTAALQPTFHVTCNQSRDEGFESMAAGRGAQRLITIFVLSVNSSLCGIYFCDTAWQRCKTDGQILSLDSCPSSSEYDMAKTINCNYVTDEFASVKARTVTL
jgi:hypothetical protein